MCLYTGGFQVHYWVVGLGHLCFGIYLYICVYFCDLILFVCLFVCVLEVYSLLFSLFCMTWEDFDFTKKYVTQPPSSALFYGLSCMVIPVRHMTDWRAVWWRLHLTVPLTCLCFLIYTISKQSTLEKYASYQHHYYCDKPGLFNDLLAFFISSSSHNLMLFICFEVCYYNGMLCTYSQQMRGWTVWLHWHFVSPFISFVVSRNTLATQKYFKDRIRPVRLQF